MTNPPVPEGLAEPASLPPSMPGLVRERCFDCGGGGLTSHGDNCPSCHGHGHT